MIKDFMRILALNTAFMCSLANANMPTIYVKKFATSPDKQLTLYQQINSEYQNRQQVFYRGQDGKIQKAMDLYMSFGDMPNVTWHGNLAMISNIMGADATQTVFIDAKRGAYQVGNMAHFDPTHECLLTSADKGEGLSFFRLFDSQPRRKLDLIGLNVDKDWAFPINSIAIGGENKFLPNGDFQFDYFDKNNQRKLIVIQNPCNNN